MLSFSIVYYFSLALPASYRIPDQSRDTFHETSHSRDVTKPCRINRTPVFRSQWLHYPLHHPFSTNMTRYDNLREENIARNRKLLEALMDKDLAAGTQRPQPKQTRRGRQSAPAKSKKRIERTGEETEDFRPMKRVRPEIPQSGLRRSQRNAGKEMPDYQGESHDRLPRPVTARVGVDNDGDPRRPSGKRIHDPYAW